MDDSTSPETEVEQPAVQEEAQLEQDIEIDQAEVEQPEADDTEEIEVDGKKYKVHKDLKDNILMRQDYTRKTQEVAEQRRAVEEMAQRHQQRLSEYAQLASIDAQLQQFQNVDWNAAIDQDPVEAQKASFRFQELQRVREYVAQSLSQKEQRALLEQQFESAKRLEQGRQALSKEIPNWSPELGASLAEYGVTLGASKQSMQNVSDPWLVKALYKASLYDKALAKAKNAAKPAPEQATPVPKVSGKSASASSNPEKMSTAEWMAWRAKQAK